MAEWSADSTGLGAVKGEGGASYVARLRSTLAHIAEMESQRLTIWSPVLLVSGIWTYFALPQEPSRLLGMVLIAGVLGVLWRARQTAWAMALAIAVAGFLLAQLRTEIVATQLVRAVVVDVALIGHVVDVERRSAKRAVLIIDVETADGVPVDEVPRRARLTLNSAKTLPQIGDKISGKAVLAPLPMPVSPGAFDWGRSLFFQSVGATGRFEGRITVLADNVPLSYQMRRGFHQLRGAIGERVRAVIPGPLGSFADALITGERAQIPRAMNESLQASGLFHILSISGLHMAMVVGSAFWMARALLALSTTLALTRPIKAWAADVALAVGLFYMLLADSGAATERSFIMVAVMLFAIMVNRPAISLHNLAVAAIIILVFEPEQAVAASFQMSFLAVMGLASFFEWWNARTAAEFRPQTGWLARWSRNGALFVVGSLLTSLIAGALSGISAAHHFGRIAPYSVIANALALPIVSIAVMPMALAATLLMPLGLEALPLWIMGQGLQAVMQISDWVASWPQAGLALPFLAPAAAAGIAFAAAFMTMARSALRWLAVPFLTAGILFWINDKPADVYIEDRVRAVAIRNPDGFLVPPKEIARGFALQRWLEANGQRESGARAALRGDWNCEGSVCRVRVRESSVAFLRETADIRKTCPSVDILIAQYPLRRTCKGKLVTIDRFDVWRKGAHSVKISPKITVRTARDMQGARPWVWAARPRSPQRVQQ